MKHQHSQSASIKPTETPSTKTNDNISYKKRREELDQIVKRYIELKKLTTKI